MQAFAITNRGREIAATDYWETKTSRTKSAFSFNAGALRVLAAHNLAAELAREAPTGRVAVLSIGPDEAFGRGGAAAGLMFDDGSESPYCMVSSLNAFDALPSRTDDERRDLECLVYAPGPRLVARMPLRIRHTTAQDKSPVEV